MDRIGRHFGNLCNGSLTNPRHITNHILIGSLECLLPESGQPDPTTVGVHIPHILYNLFPLLHLQNIEIIPEGGIEIVGQMVEVAGGPPEGDGAGEHGPEGKE